MKIKIAYFLFIFFIAIFVRFVFLDTSPPALNWDEASLGYNSFSILKTGKDEWGKVMPLSFEAFGDFKLPGYIYTLVPFISFFGLSEFAVRLPSRVAGVIAVLLIFLITKRLTGDIKMGFIAALLLGISPWHLFLSRIAVEANLAFTFFLAAFYFYISGLKRNYLLLLSAIFFGLTIFTYNSARVFVPLFLLGSVLVFKREILNQGKKLILPSVILISFMFLAAILAIFYDSSSRYFWVAIVDQGAINFLNESRSASNLPEIITKLIYNRYIYFITQFIPNYFSHFSFDFLFFKGGSHYQFSLPNTGLMYLIELPFLILGIIQLLKQKGLSLIILIWLLIAPIPSAITREAPHALRAIFMLGALQIIVTYGIFYLYELIKGPVIKKALLYSLPIIFFIGCTAYLYKYFVFYPKQYSQAWQYGYHELFSFLNSYQDSKIYITKRYGEPHIFYLFYNQYDPLKYQQNPTLVRYEKTQWRWVDRLDNLVFINDWEIEGRDSEIGSIVVTAPGNLLKDAQLLQTIYFLDGSKAFDVVKL